MPPKKETITDRINKYLEPVKNSNDGYMCNACDPPKPINGKYKSNLLQHFRIKHKEIHDGPSYVPDAETAKRRLEKIQAFTEIVSINGRPFNYLLDSGFQKAMSGELQQLHEAGFPIYKSNLLNEVKDYSSHIAREIRKRIKDEVNGRLISLLIDIGTTNGKSFLGICAQFMHNDEIQIRTLSMVPLEKQHTAEYVRQKMTECMDEFGIKLIQSISITSDNGSNMLATTKGFDELAQNEQEVGDLQRFDRNEYTDDQLDGLFERIAQIQAFDAIINDNENYEQLFEEVIGEMSQHTNLISTIRCGCHVCQLIAKHGMKKSNVRNLLAVCQYVVKKLHTQTFQYEAAENNIKYKKPHLSCTTRWDSELRMVR